MTVTAVHKDTEKLTMQVVTEFDAPVERVWQLWADPRKLERWWGPPTYPATVVEHELVPGGKVTYYMTGPEGDQHHGWWRVVAVDPPRRLELEDGFADAEGNVNPDMPSMMLLVELAAIEGGTRMTITSTFATLAAMEQVLAMGAEEGMRQALGQIEAILAEEAV